MSEGVREGGRDVLAQRAIAIEVLITLTLESGVEIKACRVCMTVVYAVCWCPAGGSRTLVDILTFARRHSSAADTRMARNAAVTFGAFFHLVESWTAKAVGLIGLVLLACSIGWTLIAGQSLCLAIGRLGTGASIAREASIKSSVTKAISCVCAACK